MFLHWAALGGHDELVSYLIGQDVPVDPMDDVSVLIKLKLITCL